MCSLTVHRVVLLNKDSSTPVIHVGVLLDYHRIPSPFRNNDFIVKIFETAFASIQTQSDLLTGYRIQMHIRYITSPDDHFIDEGQAAIQMVNLLQLGEPKVAVLGPFWDVHLYTTAKIASNFRTIQLSPVSRSAISLRDPRMSTLYRIIQDFHQINRFRIKLMKHFGWTRAATIVTLDDLELS
ncbi:hypothetical protein DPMN_139004 [Dreissena polymorpha]|uniref:Receptor ligand binding region domain-containing protein n=1 Tax=Dreissena polymorpha TaxID=45954 RepID=A0A9D4G890_DREPO|nr:hypothetical protein DPMN_139004 [Dreissena polymorpha]